MTDRWPATGIIFACARMDALKARAAAGDARAVAILLRLLPPDLPPSERLRQRDAEIRRLAAWLRDALRGDVEPRPHQVAMILSGDRTAVRALDRAEQRQLRAEIDSIAQWTLWPTTARQFETIIGQW